MAISGGAGARRRDGLCDRRQSRESSILRSARPDRTFLARSPRRSMRSERLPKGDRRRACCSRCRGAAPQSIAGCRWSRTGHGPRLLGIPSDQREPHLAGASSSGLDRARRQRPPDVRDVVSDASTREERFASIYADHHARAAVFRSTSTLFELMARRLGRENRPRSHRRGARMNDDLKRSCSAISTRSRRRNVLASAPHHGRRWRPKCTWRGGRTSSSSLETTIWLADQAEVVEAGKRGLDRYGAGTASVALYLRTIRRHRAPQPRSGSRISRTEASLTSMCRLDANTGLFSDALRRGSRSSIEHCDLRAGHVSLERHTRHRCDLSRQGAATSTRHGRLESEMLQAGRAPFRFVVRDRLGVFSMEGDLAKLPEMVALAKRYGAVSSSSTIRMARA